MHDMGATSWGLLDMHGARRSPFLFRRGVNLPPPHPIGKGWNGVSLLPRNFV